MPPAYGNCRIMQRNRESASRLTFHSQAPIVFCMLRGADWALMRCTGQTVQRTDLIAVPGGDSGRRRFAAAGWNSLDYLPLVR